MEKNTDTPSSSVRKPRMKVLPPKQWTKGMIRMAHFATLLSQALLGKTPVVRIVRTSEDFKIRYVGEHLNFNLLELGHSWFERSPTREAVIKMLFEEFSYYLYYNRYPHQEYEEVLNELINSFKRFSPETPKAFRAFTKEEGGSDVS